MKLKEKKPIKKQKKTESIKLTCQTRDPSYKTGTTQ
jgi:hypothetical protein